MRGARILAAAVAFAVLLGTAVVLLRPRPPAPPRETVVVAWRGERFELPKAAPEYDEAQAARIARVLRSETPPAFLPSFQALIDYQRTRSVPGYGESTGGFGDDTPRGRFTAISVQIPRTEQHRVLVYRQEGDGYRLFDDFTYDGPYPPSLTFKVEGDRLLYVEDLTRRVVRTRP